MAFHPKKEELESKDSSGGWPGLSPADIKILQETDPDVPCPHLPPNPGTESGWTDDSKESVHRAIKRGWTPRGDVSEALRIGGLIPIERPVEVGDSFRDKEQAKILRREALLYEGATSEDPACSIIKGQNEPEELRSEIFQAPLGEGMGDSGMVRSFDAAEKFRQESRKQKQFVMSGNPIGRQS